MDIYFNGDGSRAKYRKAETADSPKACGDCGRNYTVDVMSKPDWTDPDNKQYNVECSHCGKTGATRRTTQQAIDTWNE